jgi:CheY-like chemotaxis protein
MTTVLVVEDDADIREEIRLLFEEENHVALVARSRPEALRILEQPSPRIDLVILDLMMPEGSGWELLLDMRSRTFLARVPVVIVSALAPPPDRLGAHAYLQKPFDRVALLETVQRLLGLRLTARVDRHRVAPSVEAPTRSPASRRVQVLIVEDNVDIRESEAALLQEHGFGTTLAADGIEALDALFLEDPPIDIVLVDLMLPKCGGWEMLAQMRAHSVLSRIPVLIVSAFAAPPAGLEYQGYVQKPFRPEVLLRAVDGVSATLRPGSVKAS